VTSRGSALACALAVVVVLVADGVTVAVRHGGPVRPHTPSALERVLPDLESFVERERGMRFRRPVRVELQSDADFTATLRRLPTDASGPPTAVLAGLFRALGLVEGRFDPAALDAGTESQVLGFYDSRRRRLYVRGDQPTPAVRRVVVHELTHALDDQYFGLERPDLDRRDDEAVTAFAALVEGDALRVESRYFDTLSPDEQRQAALDAGTAKPSADVPRIFGVLLAFPYVAGRTFVDALLAAGGTARLDAAFGAPPTTTEAVLHPDRYLAGERPQPVADPTADGPVLARGVLGELLFRLVLQETLDRGVAAAAAEGWGGDRYAAWSDGPLTCVRDRVVMDTPGDGDQLVGALRGWAAGHPGTVLDEGATVILTRCG
jgi:hypothetical protein